MTMMLFIIVCAAIGFAYILIQKKNDNLMNHRGVIEMIPSFISTLGVLGTFAGITMGLYYFDTANLPTSIPLLLNGLKTAFFTSLAGMVGSLFLSGQVNKLFDEKTGGVSDTAEAAGIIVKALDTLKGQVESQANSQTLFYNTAQQIIQKINIGIDNLTANTETMKLALNTLGIEVGNIKDNQTSMEGKAESIYSLWAT